MRKRQPEGGCGVGARRGSVRARRLPTNGEPPPRKFLGRPPPPRRTGRPLVDQGVIQPCAAQARHDPEQQRRDPVGPTGREIPPAGQHGQGSCHRPEAEEGSRAPVPGDRQAPFHNSPLSSGANFNWTESLLSNPARDYVLPRNRWVGWGPRGSHFTPAFSTLHLGCQHKKRPKLQANHFTLITDGNKHLPSLQAITRMRTSRSPSSLARSRVPAIVMVPS